LGWEWGGGTGELGAGSREVGEREEEEVSDRINRMNRMVKRKKV